MAIFEKYFIAIFNKVVNISMASEIYEVKLTLAPVLLHFLVDKKVRHSS